MMHDVSMRTTLDIAPDVIAAARALAVRDGRTLGEVVSDLARKALRPTKAGKVRNGVPLLPLRSNSPKPSLALVNSLRDEAS